MNRLLSEALHIPTNAPVPVISVAPVTLSAPGRALDLEVRISAPVSGHDLPVIVLSHGHGPSLYLPSLNGYGPLVNFWAAHGFVVIQPTHLSARSYALGSETPGAPLFWRSRVEDMSRVLDQLDTIEAAVPGLTGRLNRDRVAAVGHSMGGQTVGMLLGARLTDPRDNTAIDVNLMDSRFRAGVLLAAPGSGRDLSSFAAENYSALNPDFSHMTTPALVVAGDADINPHLNVRGAAWHADPYHLSPGPKSLLTLVGGGHGLGGIAGYDAKETTDEDPDRLGAVQRLSWAYLRSALDPADPAWSAACAALQGSAKSLGSVESK
ncbi:alpha/beta fold hydrolase [Devosia sp.]|uniref:alpha/beta hydrolase family protein n=1 Tax=Devosia sp. TaxID=1871048 RepID=UPI002736DCC7|nr:alpha/beta fold hydrolase [Devosia sp.]MDP2779315.1 chlorophyllase [Devosia sp.]